MPTEIFLEFWCLGQAGILCCFIHGFIVDIMVMDASKTWYVLLIKQLQNAKKMFQCYEIKVYLYSKKKW